MSSENSSNVGTALLYGTIATAVVSLLSLSGAAILPLVTGTMRQRWLQFFIAMAVSTLSSDALLHLIPEIMGVHKHGPNEHKHEHGGEEHNHSHGSHEEEGHRRAKRHTEKAGTWDVTEDRERLIWMSIVLLAVYLTYLFEFVVFYKKRHLHHPEKVSHCPAHDEQHFATQRASDSSRSSESVADQTRCCGLTSRALVILLGDGVHNLVDGVAIGTSFLASPQLGLLTSIAVVCHELPHELGDLAVLLDSGMSMAKALGLNLLSALSAFIGLYISIAIGRNETVERALLALTAGMFLYVAWIDMLSHLKHDSVPTDHWTLVCGIQFAGFIVGYAIVFFVGWFEHDMFPTAAH